jgi:hypothetical protein
MQSALREKPRRTQGPLASEAIITARCEMLLSPETVISASIRGARLIRKFSMNEEAPNRRPAGQARRRIPSWEQMSSLPL